MVKGDQICG